MMTLTQRQLQETHVLEALPSRGYSNHEVAKVLQLSVRRMTQEHQLLSPRKHRKERRHPSRERRSIEGELSQADVSPFDWLNAGESFHLHEAIDDATGKILALYWLPWKPLRATANVYFS